MLYRKILKYYIYERLQMLYKILTNVLQQNYIYIFFFIKKYNMLIQYKYYFFTCITVVKIHVKSAMIYVNIRFVCMLFLRHRNSLQKEKKYESKDLKIYSTSAICSHHTGSNEVQRDATRKFKAQKCLSNTLTLFEQNNI